MRVLIAASSFPRFEGDYYGKFVFDLCERLSSSGIGIKVLTPKSSVTRGKMRNINVERFAYMPSKRLETIPNNTLKYLPLRRLPELLPYTLSAYLKICREKIDLIHAHFALPMGFLCASTPKDTPLLVTCHGSDCTLPLERRILRPFLKQVFNRGDKIVAVSEFIKRVSMELGVEEKKIEVIYQGIDVEKFHPSVDKRSLKKRIGYQKIR